MRQIYEYIKRYFTGLKKSGLRSSKKVNFFIPAIIIVFQLFNCGLSKQTEINLLIPLSLIDSSNSTTTTNLTGLTISSGTLSPTFSADTTSYTATVTSGTSTIDVTPTLSNSTSSSTVSGTQVLSGSSATISLNVGSNSITILVDHGNGTSTTYTITVTREISTTLSLSALTLSNGILSPTFSSSTTSYTANGRNAVSSITVTPTVTDTSSTITVNGSTVASGVASSAIALAEGSNTITIIVTATDSSSLTYSITYNRLAANTYRMFVTATSYKGNLGGVSGADTKCSSDSLNPFDGSTFKALIVDGTNRSTGTDWVLKASSNYLRASDLATIFTTNGSSTFSFGALTNAISSSAASVWTGLNSDWTSSTDHCTNWSISNASKAGIAGNGAATDGTVILDGSIDTKCNNLYYLICVEQ